jgi:hypothetical protein
MILKYVSYNHGILMISHLNFLILNRSDCMYIRVLEMNGYLPIIPEDAIPNDAYDIDFECDDFD